MPESIDPEYGLDKTFRLYDWTEEYGRKGRRLDTAEAVESSSLRSPHAISCGAMIGNGVRLLVRNPHYWIREHRAADGWMEFEDSSEPRILAVASGSVTVATGDSRELEMERGATLLIPAVLAGSMLAKTAGTAALLEIGLR